MPGYQQRQSRPSAPPLKVDAIGAPKKPTQASRQQESVFAFPDLGGLLLVALVSAWLGGIFLASFVALPFWLLVGAGIGCIGLTVLSRWLGLPGKTAGWLALSFLLLASMALGAARLVMAGVSKRKRE